MFDSVKDSPQKYISQLINVFSQVPAWYEENEKELDYRDKEYNDLNHALELINFDVFRGYKLAMALKENRINRRAAKNALESLKPLYDLVKKHHNALHDMRRCMGEINKILDTQKKRVYYPRVPDSPLTEVFYKAQKDRIEEGSA